MKKFTFLFLFFIMGTLFAQERALKKIQNYAKTQTQLGSKVTTEGISKLFKTQDTGKITFGTEKTFNVATTSYVTVIALNETKFVVAFSDDDNSNYGTAIVGTVSGTSITYDYTKDVVFCSSETRDISMAKLTNTTFVIVYNQYISGLLYSKVDIGTVSGSDITFTGAVDVKDQHRKGNLGVARLTNIYFIIAYYDVTDKYGKVVTANTSLNFNTAKKFSDGIVDAVSVATFDDTYFIISFKDVHDSDKGKIIAGYRSSAMIFLGPEVTFYSSKVYSRTDIITLDDTHFVLGYNSSTNPNWSVFCASGSRASSSSTTVTILDNLEYLDSYYNYFSISPLNSKHFVIAVQNKNAQIGEISGSDEISFLSTETEFEPNVSTSYVSTAALTNSTTDARFLVAWQTTRPDEKDASKTVYFGESRVGTIEGTIAPVELTSFTAKELEDSILLNWETATEVNNYGFQVERKKDKLESEWEVIGFVEGHGNSNSSNSYSFMDGDYLNEEVYYRIKQVDINGGSEYYPSKAGLKVNIVSISALKIEQNYPNPFNPSTTIDFTIPNTSKGLTNARLTVFNALGQEVAILVNKQLSAGSYSVTFNASNIPSGVYLYKLTATNNLSSNFSQTRKMILLK